MAFALDEQLNEVIRHGMSRYIYRKLQPLMSGENENLNELVVPLTVMVELFDSSPVAADRFISAVSSDASFDIWMNLMSLPKNGWLGMNPPVPALSNVCENYKAKIQAEIPELDLPYLPCRVTGHDIANVINDSWESGSIYHEEPYIFVDVLELLLKTLPTADTYIRTTLFERETSDEDGFNFSLNPIGDAEAALPLAVGAARIARFAGRMIVSVH